MKKSRLGKMMILVLAVVMVFAFATTAFAYYPYYTWSGNFPLVERGDYNNNAVAAAQLVLYRLNYGIVVDGDFGSGTESKVKTYQTSAGLTSDGIVGSQTWGNMQNSWLTYAYESSPYKYYRINYVAGYTFRHGKYSGYWYVAYNPVNSSNWYYVS